MFWKAVGYRQLEKDEWDSVHFDRINTASDMDKKADIAAVLISDTEANLCIITPHMTITRSHMEAHIPKKRLTNDDARQRAFQTFYQNVAEAVVQHVNPDVIQVVLIIGPGFWKDEFHDVVKDPVGTGKDEELRQFRGKWMTVGSSSASLRSLHEALSDPTVRHRLEDTKASTDVMALEELFRVMHSDQDRATYGFRARLAQMVQGAAERGAVDKLLLTDVLFRSPDVNTRNAYIDLTNLVRGAGGSVHLFSGMHSSGERLAQLSGVAATLRFPLPDLDEVLEAERQHTAVAAAGGEDTTGAGPPRLGAVMEMGRGAQGESWELGDDESSSTSPDSDAEGGWRSRMEDLEDEVGLLERCVAGSASL